MKQVFSQKRAHILLDIILHVLGDLKNKAFSYSEIKFLYISNIATVPPALTVEILDRHMLNNNFF